MYIRLHILVAILWFVAGYGCKEASSVEEKSLADNNTAKLGEKAPTGTFKYCFVTNDDTALLTLYINEDNIRGTYMHHYAGKDRSDGDLLDARFDGDTLYADYKYWSEGVWSLREVVFLIRNGQAREGYGELIMQGDKQVYKDPDHLFFEGPLLSTANCSGNVDKINKK